MLSRPLTRLQPTRMAASSRLAALSAHFSSSASAPSAPAKMSPSAAAEQPVLFEAIHSLRKVTLNRPNKLNVLNSEIVLPLKEQMEVRKERGETFSEGDRGGGRRLRRGTEQDADFSVGLATCRSGKLLSLRRLCC
jgi:hypothetical protein